MIIYTSLIILLAIISLVIFINTKAFGRLPKGHLLRQLTNSTNYYNKQFHNFLPTATFTPGGNSLHSLLSSLLKNHKELRPEFIPSVRTDLFSIPLEINYFVWFGHSSYFLQIDNKRILVDPVFSKSASPLPFIVKAFKGTNNYSPQDIPVIDYLLITHDHWDHLDYQTITKISAKRIICPLGIRAYLEYWKIPSSKIMDGDWNDTLILDDKTKITLLPSRHFSGRSLKRDATLWTSYALETVSKKIFLSCDGGYGPHFKEFGKTFQGFDLAFLENGQYNDNWRNIHMHPEEVVQAANDLNAKNVMPIHSSKFSLAPHPWDEPLKSIYRLSQNQEFNLLTPMIGQAVYLDKPNSNLKQWWQNH